MDQINYKSGSWHATVIWLTIQFTKLDQFTRIFLQIWIIVSANNAVIWMIGPRWAQTFVGWMGPFWAAQNFRPNMIGPLKTVTGPKLISLGPVITNAWTPLWSQFRDISLLDTSSLLDTKIDNDNNNGYNFPAQSNVEVPHRTSWPRKMEYN